MSLSPSDRDELASLVADMQKWFGEKVSLARRRALMDMAETALKLPDGVIASPWRRGALGGLWLANATRKDQRALLYLHGGGYATGSSKSHRNLAAAVALAARADALVLDYRLAPEHPFPAALNDAVEAYTALLEQRPASAIAVAGDSAGGGLTVAMTLALRARGLALPGALVCMSPWLDQRGLEFSPQEQARLDDPLTTLEEMTSYSAQYRGIAAATDPLVSPLLADLSDLPHTLIQVGGGELLLRDSLAFAALARNTSVTLEIEDKLPHVWQWFFHRLRLGRTAIERIGRFIDERLRQ